MKILGKTLHFANDMFDTEWNLQSTIYENSFCKKQKERYGKQPAS